MAPYVPKRFDHPQGRPEEDRCEGGVAMRNTDGGDPKEEIKKIGFA
jgi:hypothetical protein